MAKRSKKELNDELRSFADLANEITNSIDAAIKKQRDLVGSDMFDDISDQIRDVQAVIDLGFESNVKRVKTLAQSLKGTLEIRRQEINLLNQLNIKILESQELVEQVKNEYLGMFESLSSFLTKIPGSNFLLASLQLDKIKSELEEKLIKTIQGGVTDSGISLGALKDSMIITFSAMAQTIGKTLMLVLTNPVILTIALTALLIKKFVDLNNAAEEFRKETGLTVSQTRELNFLLQDSTDQLRRFGISLEDMFKSTAAVYENFGNINFVSLELITNVAKLASNLGIGEKTSAQVLAQFMGMSSLTDSTAINLIVATTQLAKMAGVAPRGVIEDIAENSEFIALYFKGSAIEAAKTAVEIHRMGLNLSQVSKITERIMNFESSIEDELMASLLLGKQINLNRARQLVFNGDIEQATKEIFNQIGSLERFNTLNLIQKKSLADLTGLSADELQRTLMIQEKLNLLNSEQRKAYEDTKHLLGDISGLNRDQLLNQIEQQSVLKKINNSFMSIGTSLSRVFLPILQAIDPILNVIAGGVAWISDGINKVVSGISSAKDGTENWASSLITASVIIAGIILAWKGLSLLMSGLGKAGGGALTSLGTGFAGFANALSALVNPVALAGLAIFIGSMIGLGFALKLAAPGIEAFGKAIGFIVEKIGGAFVIMIDQLGDTISKIATFGPNLYVAAGGLLALSSSLIAFGSTSAFAGISNLVNKFFGSDPITQFERLAKIAPNLVLAATGINELKHAFADFSVSKIDFGDIAQDIPQITQKTSSLSKVISNGNNKIVEKLEEVIDTMKKLELTMDGRKVNNQLSKSVSTAKQT